MLLLLFFRALAQMVSYQVRYGKPEQIFSLKKKNRQAKAKGGLSS